MRNKSAKDPSANDWCKAKIGEKLRLEENEDWRKTNVEILNERSLGR